jgi:hypothetical protein
MPKLAWKLKYGDGLPRESSGRENGQYGWNLHVGG